MWNVDDPAAPAAGRPAVLPQSPLPFDRNAPYLRIAAEEAWSIPEIPQAQLRLLDSPAAPDDTSLRMGAMFAAGPTAAPARRISARSGSLAWTNWASPGSCCS